MSDYNGWKVELEEAQARIRKQRELLDECERALQEIADIQVVAASDMAVVALKKLRAREKADE